MHALLIRSHRVAVNPNMHASRSVCALADYASGERDQVFVVSYSLTWLSDSLHRMELYIVALCVLYLFYMVAAASKVN